MTSQQSGLLPVQQAEWRLRRMLVLSVTRYLMYGLPIVILNRFVIWAELHGYAVRFRIDWHHLLAGRLSGRPVAANGDARKQERQTTIFPALFSCRVIGLPTIPSGAALAHFVTTSRTVAAAKQQLWLELEADLTAKRRADMAIAIAAARNDTALEAYGPNHQGARECRMISILHAVCLAALCGRSTPSARPHPPSTDSFLPACSDRQFFGAVDRVLFDFRQKVARRKSLNLACRTWYARFVRWESEKNGQ